jgi:hypothetical protein
MREQKVSEFKFYRFNKEALEAIYKFYMENKVLIDGFQQDGRVCVTGFDGKQINLGYPKAKVIDMIGFIRGGEILAKKKEEKKAKNKAAGAEGGTKKLRKP